MSDNNFDWNTDDSVIFKSYYGVSVYLNSGGDIVLRQEKDAYQDEDEVIVIPQCFAQMVAQAILDKVKG
jgi:hypothetical protein